MGPCLCTQRSNNQVHVVLVEPHISISFSVLYCDGMNAHLGTTAKCKAKAAARKIVTKYSNDELAEFTKIRCDELQRMTNPSPAVRCCKTLRWRSSELKWSAIIANHDVPHRLIMQVDEMPLHWLNRYSIKALRYPLFDPMSLITFVRGKPLMVPIDELVCI